MTPEQETWKERLEKLSVSQMAFANLLNIYPGELCEYLQCRREPRVERYMQIENSIKTLESKKGNDDA